MANSLSILIPAYDEQATIGQVVRRVRSVDLTPLVLQKEIIVVDDGSRDDTASAARRAAEGDPRVVVIRHPHNLGKGAAIRTALQAARGDICLVQDADLEYFVEDYGRLIAAMAQGAPVVFGSRFAERAWPVGMKLANWVANKLLTFFANLLFGHFLTDEATGFKVFRTDLLRQLDLECTRFEFCPEVTAKLGLLQVPILEVPVRYCGRSAKQGKKIRWNDGFKALATLHKYWWRGRKWQPALVDRDWSLSVVTVNSRPEPSSVAGAEPSFSLEPVAGSQPAQPRGRRAGARWRARAGTPR